MEIGSLGDVLSPEAQMLILAAGLAVAPSLGVGIQKLIGNLQAPPYLAVISVFFIAAMVGLIDDISNIPQRLKVIAVAFAALPLLLVHIGDSINLPFGDTIGLVGWVYFLYWLLLGPFGGSGVAHAMNMTGGGNAP